MTINSEAYKEVANGNGVATSFSFSPIVIYQADHLEVFITDSSGNVTFPVLDTDYSVVVTSYPGTGSVTYPLSGSALPSGSSITMRLRLPITQLLDLQNQGGYFPDLQEKAFDFAAQVNLQQQEQLDRCIKVAGNEEPSNIELPTATARANKFLAFDGTGLPIASSGGISGSVPVSAFGQTLIDDANAAAALTTLGVSTQAQEFLTANRILSTDASATEGPIYEAYRNSASPATNDLIGGIRMVGKDSGAADQTYAKIVARIDDATAASEDASLLFTLVKAGSLVQVDSLSANSTDHGRFGGRSVFTSSGSFVKSSFPNLKFVDVYVIGGGGGGGGAAATGAGEGAMGGTGGGGGFSQERILASALAASETVTVGAGGAASASGNAPGGAGGTSSFGAFLSAPGGTGGLGSGAAAANGTVQGSAGGVGTGGEINLTGQRGGPCVWAAGIVSITSNGGDAAGPYAGKGAHATTANAAGNAGLDYGGGGTGAVNQQSQSARAGAAGGAGLVVVELYF